MKETNLWGRLLYLAGDIPNDRRCPQVDELEHLGRMQAAAGKLQCVIGDGVTAINSLLLSAPDDLEAYQAMDLARLLASLGEVNLLLQMFADDARDLGAISPTGKGALA